MPVVLPLEGKDARGMPCPMPVGSRGGFVVRTSAEAGETQLLFYAGAFSDASFVEHYSALIGREMTGFDGPCLVFAITVPTAVARAG